MVATVIGMHTAKKNGKTTSTLHLAEEFSDYMKNASEGRTASGKQATSVYIGEYPTTDITIGAEIEILYDKAIVSNHGTFQPINRILVVKKGN